MRLPQLAEIKLVLGDVLRFAQIWLIGLVAVMEGGKLEQTNIKPPNYDLFNIFLLLPV